MSHWLKIDAVLSALHDEDIVLYLDSDAYFFDHSRSIENLVDVHLPQHQHMLVGTDRKNGSFAWSDTNANTGVFVVRNTEMARKILTEWQQMPNHGTPFAFDWPVEEGAFNSHILPNYRTSIALVDYLYLNGTDGEFVRHLVGEPDDERAEVLRQEYERLVVGGSIGGDENFQ